MVYGIVTVSIDLCQGRYDGFRLLWLKERMAMIPIDSGDGGSPEKEESEVDAASAAGAAPLDDPQCLLDEMAAAEAQLKAAQERYDAVKARIEASSVSSAAAAEVMPDGCSGTASTGEGVGDSEPTAGYTPPSYTQAPHAVPNAVPPTSSSQQPYYTYQQPSSYSYTQPSYNAPVAASKDHVAAGLLAIFLGFLGIHKFYLGYNTSGFIMLAVSILGSLLTFCLAGAVMWVIAIVEGILYLTKSQTEFEQTYVFNKREWF